MRRRDKIVLQKILNVIDETNEFLENVSEEEFFRKKFIKIGNGNVSNKNWRMSKKFK